MDQPELTKEALLPDLPNYNPEPADGIRVGDSPVPGLTLKRILRGHEGVITRIAWSSDGRFLASPSLDKTIRIWDLASGECKAVLEGHDGFVSTVAWSPDSKHLASGQEGNGAIKIWNVNDWKVMKENIVNGAIYDLNWRADNTTLSISGSFSPIKRWNPFQGKQIIELVGHNGRVQRLRYSPDKRFLASCSNDDTIRLWDSITLKTIRVLQGHDAEVFDIDWHPDGDLLASGSWDKTIRIWDINTGQEIKKLEAHTDWVTSLGFTFDGRLLISRSKDNTVRIWSTKSWNSLIELQEEHSSYWEPSFAIHKNLPILASLGEKDTVIRIWELDIDFILKRTTSTSIPYTTAKLVLVGDSGVGKTGLGWRLAHNEFKEQSSTHGQQFWPIPDFNKTRDDGTQCEAVLWDLAGQPVYGHVHPLFLDKVDTALVLFDPTNRRDPYKGVEFWLNHLKGKSELPPSILIGARSDRGESVLSQEELEQFCQYHGVSGGYVSTSALDNIGIDELKELIKSQIPWDEMTATVTTQTFKRIKDFVLTLKEQPERRNVLVNPAELRQQLQETDPGWEFSNAEMMTATGHLETHGYVTILKSASGDQHILLAPDLLATLAASIVLLADKHPRELGAVNESELLKGSQSFAELQGLDENEQRILLDAAVHRFIEHNICFREKLDNDVLLIFPGLIKQKRPLQDDIPTTDDIAYIVRGQVDNIYASLVVLLGYTPTFSRINQWQNQAQYQTEEGHICGFRLIEEREGEIELILYYSNDMPADEQLQFESLFEKLLRQRDAEVTPYPPVRCPNGHIQERAVIIKRQQSGHNFTFCHDCGEKVIILEVAETPNIGLSAAPWLQQEEAIARLRTTYEAHLGRIKGHRRGFAAPRCYLSHLPQQEKFAASLRQDLSKAGLLLIEDPAKVKQDDVVLILSTPTYRETFKEEPGRLQQDIPLIQSRLNDGRHNLKALALEGQQLPQHDLDNCQPGNFTIETHYAVSLFDLVLDLYRIPFNSEGFAPLRQTLHEQWERNLMDQPTAGRQIDQEKLLDLLNEKLVIEELEPLTFGIIDDYDNIPGQTKIQKIREMIIHFHRRGQLEMLLQKITRKRPDIDFTQTYK